MPRPVLSVAGRLSATESLRGLFARYAAISLVPVALLGGGLLWATGQQASARGLAEGASEARLVARTAIAPLLDGHPLTSGLDAGERTRLAASVHGAVVGKQVMRLRLRDEAGRVVFSEDGSGLGTVDDEAVDAAGGETLAHLTYLNSDEGDRGQRGPRVVEAYTPLLTGGSSQPIGVLEVYLPYAPIAADIARGQRMLTVTMTGGLLGLWLTLLAISASVTSRLRRRSAENAYLARHDVLTGMPNRAQFARCAADAIAVATDRRPTAIAVVDLDRFKEVNDTLGHGNGDRLLVALAERLSERIREGDTVARLGGDEFGIVVRGVHGVSEAVEVLERLRSALTEPLLLDGLPLAVEASIGFALAPADGDDIETLMALADVAMYAAKRQRHGIVHYQPAHNHYDARTLALVGELGAAIRAGQLVLHFQPKTDLRTQKVTAVEALVRWQHPTRGLLHPDAFLPAVEQTELVEPLTAWVLRSALHALHDVDPTGELSVAVNISARSLTRDGFADDVLAIVAECGVAAERVILEVTETALLTDPPRAATTLCQLHQAGIRVSIDDFGAGQTSLGYLATLPITELKIDKGFVLAMSSDERNAAIVRSVIELGHSLGFTVTAEGVESNDVLEELVAAECDLVQGYLLARPMVAGALRALLDGQALPAQRV
jgi:diguanylate cyclase (GGDEF)-like protein